ncbi:hypothetical protein KC19_VG033400 [Ceratodon purpureus]|uniref:Uncharacterized protein n=1 Tax=Ceratodon purpureus TaxID=3225 RepID=A0A8T0HLI2_CERPU|nr:hypothetical protein KC19_VG033400 [Ceratodon purpureus]
MGETALAPRVDTSSTSFATLIETKDAKTTKAEIVSYHHLNGQHTNFVRWICALLQSLSEVEEDLVWKVISILVFQQQRTTSAGISASETSLYTLSNGAT